MTGLPGSTLTDPTTDLNSDALEPVENTDSAHKTEELHQLALTFQQSVSMPESDQDVERRRSAKSFLFPSRNRTLAESQSFRRRKALELQKKRREDNILARRLALDNISASSDEEDEETRMNDENTLTDGNDVSMMDINQPRSKDKKISKFANQVMYAEMMEEIPDDLLLNWSILICPVGKRCLVTSGNGETVARRRSGHVLKKCQSVLPNGSRVASRASNYSIFDCVYDDHKGTFYILDIMSWKGCLIYDCETPMRHSWLQRIRDEHDNPTSQNSDYKIEAVKPVPASELAAILSSPSEYLSHQGLSYEIDGLLFYHNEAHYTPGSTPLVYWAPKDRLSTLFQF